MIEKLIEKIANSQAFSPDDKLSQLVKKHDKDELAVESLDLVHAARKDSYDYDAFVKAAKERDGKRKQM